MRALPFFDGMVLLDGRTDRLFAYNSSAALIWHALSQSAHPDVAVTALTKVYGIPQSRRRTT